MKKVSTGIVFVALVLAGLYAANWIGLIALTSASGNDISRTISSELTAKVGSRVSVTCPRSIPEQKGGIEDCNANAGHGTTLIRLIQDDSRGHFHYVVNDPSALATLPTMTQACVSAGGSPGQCGCVEQAIRSSGKPDDLARALTAYTDRVPLPDDLAVRADSCRTGA